MADIFKGIITADGKKRQLPYRNVLETPVSDETLSVEGAFADSKAVGDKFKEVNAETGSLKEDIGNLNDKKITKFYASNLGETHIADSDDGKIADMMLYGKSEQKQYSGRNLMPNFDDFETTVSGVSIKAKNGIITLEGNSIATIGYSVPLKEAITLPDENIYVHLRNNAELANSSFVFKNENGQVDFASISSINRVLLASPLTGQPISEIMLSLGEGIAFKGFKMQPSLELTDEATTYEPYTGGQPSPSPDYPQEIKSVVNPTVKVCGKNLLNPTLQTTTQNGVTCTNNGDGTYTLNGTATSETDFYIYGNYTNIIRLPLDSKKTYTVKKSGNSNVQFHVGIKDDYTIVSNIKDEQIINKTGIAFIICRILSGTTLNNFVIYPQIEEGSVSTDFQPYHEQTATLPYTLNAIPVSSGGNVTIDGQQYIADYVDVERGKLVRCIGKKTVNGTEAYSREEDWNDNASVIYGFLNDGISYKNYTDIADITSDILTKNAAAAIVNDGVIGIGSTYKGLFMCLGDGYNTIEKTKEYFSSNNTDVYYVLAAPTENDLTPEEIAAFKALATYYPVTNISVNSEQLDGYTVFNYPISMENGWNYVKQQIGDTRDYIYDMDTKTQDIDTQAAEAYVNSEYAVALTELEV